MVEKKLAPTRFLQLPRRRKRRFCDLLIKLIILLIKYNNKKKVKHRLIICYLDKFNICKISYSDPKKVKRYENNIDFKRISNTRFKY